MSENRGDGHGEREFREEGDPDEPIIVGSVWNGNNKPPYAMELYVRGLDSYVWLQGYIVRGPNAGWLTTAAIPYSKHFSAGTQEKVFAGPYPE